MASIRRKNARTRRGNREKSFPRPEEEYRKSPNPSPNRLDMTRYPSWRETDLWSMILGVVALAKDATPGSTDTAAFFLPGIGLLDLEFDCAGNTEVTAATTPTRPMRELISAMTLVMRNGLTVNVSHIGEAF